MKQKFISSLFAAGGLLASAFSSQAATLNWDGSSNTNYNTAANWQNNDVPDSNDSGVMAGGGAGVTLLSGGINPGVANALQVRGGHVFNIDNAGGTLVVNSNMNVGQGVAGTGTVTQSGGSVTLGGLIMSNNATGGSSSFTLSGGSLTVSNLNLGKDFDSSFIIDGDAATAKVNGNVAAQANATYDFRLGATGVDTIDATGNMTILSGADLVVDGSSYTGTITTTITLFSYASRTDATEFNETVTGFTNFTTDVVYTATGIDLVLTSLLPAPPVIHSFTFNDHKVPAGTPVVLSWNVTDATSVTVSTVGPVAMVGSTNLTPSAATTYTLTATNANGTTTETATVSMLPSKPNVIIMLVDDWGVTDLSVPFAYDAYNDAGSPIITNCNILHKTPNLEALAAKGMKFTQAYATPKCSSSRAAILTGLHPARLGITSHLTFAGEIGNGPNNWRYKGFDATDVTLAHMLNPEGYRSIHCGKWHGGGINQYAQFPTAVGFDVNIAGSNSGQPARYIANASDGFEGNNRSMPNMDHYKGTGMYLTKALTIELNQAMTNAVNDGVPFFGYMSYYGVHRPYTTNPDAVGDYSNAHNNDHVKFATMVEAIDVSLANITSHLESLGIAEETLIIHLGDNGSESPVHGNNASIPLGIFSDFPMRGQKSDGFQGGCRVPFMISWAKLDASNPMQQSLPIVSGGVEHDIVGIEDIVPTVLSVVNTGASHFSDGYDLSPYLKGDVGVHRPQKYMLHYPHGNSPNGNLTWYREDDWKLMYYYTDDTFLLFDLANDPTESNSLTSSEPERVVRMARSLAHELDSRWGTFGKMWPIVSRNNNAARPGVDDPFFLDYTIDGRDLVDVDGDGLVGADEDVDSDGLVGPTETDYDDADTDDDGVNDYDEKRLTLDPLDPRSVFSVEAVPGTANSISLKWPSAPGLEFNILFSDDLSTPISSWGVLMPNVPAHGTLNETIQSVPATQDKKFFSIELLP